ncbi:MAG: T9SS type A sorting domain-containing protein, partial [FCB group bacterium]
KPKHIWITKSGFNAGDKVYEYKDSSWKNISGNLPNVPVNCIVYQKDSPDRLYIGTDIGVFYTDYGSNFWTPYGSGMPNVVVYDLDIQYTAKKLRAGTFGRGIWEADLMNCNIAAPNVTVTGNLSFCEGDSVMFVASPGYSGYLWTNGDTNRVIVVKESGVYSVMVSDSNGCTAKSSAKEVTVKTVGKLLINPIGRFPMCVGDTLVLSASMGFISYKWSTGDSVKRITVTQPGTYSVTVTSAGGCSKTTSIEIKYSPEKPVIYQNETVLSLLNPNPTYSYKWELDTTDLGENQTTINITKLGKYKVIATDTNGCVSSSDVYDVVSSVGDKNALSNSISIHPNPNNGNFMLDVNTSFFGNMQVNISNVLGENLINFITELNGRAFSKEINMTLFPSGIYFINVSIGDRSYVQKIIKE